MSRISQEGLSRRLLCGTKYCQIQAKYFISIGSFCALTASLLGSLFPMPRIIYAMSSDGLLFNFLSHIFPPTGTPLIATVITGVFASVLALIVSLRDLIGWFKCPSFLD